MKRFICRVYNEDDLQWYDAFTKEATNCKLVGFKELVDLLFECEIGRYFSELDAIKDIVEKLQEACKSKDGFFDIEGDPESGEPTEYQLTVFNV